MLDFSFAVCGEHIDLVHAEDTCTLAGISTAQNEICFQSGSPASGLLSPAWADSGSDTRSKPMNDSSVTGHTFRDPLVVNERLEGGIW